MQMSFVSGLHWEKIKTNSKIKLRDVDGLKTGKISQETNFDSSSILSNYPIKVIGFKFDETEKEKERFHTVNSSPIRV